LDMSSWIGGSPRCLGTVSLSTDAAGNASFIFHGPVLSGLQYVTATATRQTTGDTSEFAANLGVLSLTGTPGDNPYFIGLDAPGKRVEVHLGNGHGALLYSAPLTTLSSILV